MEELNINNNEPQSYSNLFASFRALVEHRRAVRIFDPNLEFDHNCVERCLKLATLAPNSSNLQLWEFHRIKNKDMLKNCVPICLNQNAAKTARELIVIVNRRDLWKKRRDELVERIKEIYPETDIKARSKLLRYYKLVPGVYTSDPIGILGSIRNAVQTVRGLFHPVYREVTESDLKAISHKSCAFAGAIFMLGIQSEGYASCPMEGFDSHRMKKLLHLPLSAEVSMVIAVGPPCEKGIYGPRMRIDFERTIHRYL